MLRARLLDILLRAGARLGRDASGGLLAVNVPTELSALVDDLRVELGHAVAGHRRRYVTESGNASARSYAWRRCDTCGRETLTHTDHRCGLTPGCPGRFIAWADPDPLTLDGSPVPCARRGCRRWATTVTAGGDPLCPSDLTHLALALEYRRSPR